LCDYVAKYQMSDIRESVEISASCGDLWQLMADPDAIAARCFGIYNFEHTPSGQPLGPESQMSFNVLKFAEPVLSRVVTYSPSDFLVHSKVTSGPYGLSGNVGAQLHRITGRCSRLEITGSLYSSTWQGRLGLLAFTSSFRGRLPGLGKLLAADAEVRRAA
jgi:hypothetical protein